MEAVITIVVVGTLFIVWFGCGYQATRALLRKGYGAAPDLDSFAQGAQQWDPISRGSQFGPSTYTLVLPCVGGPIAVLIVALLPPRHRR
jgi:hypothetical protein